VVGFDILPIAVLPVCTLLLAFELLTIDEDPVLESLRQGITAAALLLGMLTLRVLSKISGEFFGQQDHMQITFVQNMFWMV